MINLLPCEKRTQIKQLYQRNYFKSLFVSFSIVLIPPIVFVLLLTYKEHLDYKEIKQINFNLLNSHSIDGTSEISSILDGYNKIITFVTNSHQKSIIASTNISTVLNLKPISVSINSIKFDSTNPKEHELTILGIADSRNDIISYAGSLDIKSGGICDLINVPIATYTKKSQIPFTLNCKIMYE